MDAAPTDEDRSPGPPHSSAPLRRVPRADDPEPTPLPLDADPRTYQPRHEAAEDADVSPTDDHPTDSFQSAPAFPDDGPHDLGWGDPPRAEASTDAPGDNTASAGAPGDDTAPGAGSPDGQDDRLGEHAAGDPAAGEAATTETTVDQAAVDQAASGETTTAEAATGEAAADQVAPAETGSLVRPYTKTGGRTRPDYDLAIETLVSTSAHGKMPDAATSTEHQSICALCQETRSVAEVAALLRLPLGVVKVLIGDLAGMGLVVIHANDTSVGGRPSVELMERVLSGLRRL